MRLTYSDKPNPIEVEISESDVCRVSPVFLGNRVEFTPATTYSQAVLIGISTEDAERVSTHVSTLKQVARERREAEERARLEEEKQAERVYLNQEAVRLTKLAERLGLLRLLSAYLGKRAHQALIQALSVDDLKLLVKVNTSDLLTTPPAELTELAKLLSPLMSGAHLTEPKRVAHNQRFIQSERRRHKALFEGIEAHPLTDKQAEACIVNEEVTLVVAGAGTGKTSTVVGRCAYLLQAGLAAPSELLLLAYGRKASEEMSERLKLSLGAQKIHASTFHSLGLSIIGEVEGQKPTLASFVSHDAERGGHFKALQEELFRSEPTFLTQALSFFKTHLNDSRSAFDFPDAKSYYDFLRSRQFVTLKGEVVKGYCEVLIANELYLGGVPYEYEAQYQHNTADAKHRRYQPDFYLPQHGLYIEFYGVNRQGKTAPYIDSEGYQREMKWKRETHQKHNTTCLELFYYQHQEGSLLHDLWESLERRGVKRVERSEEEALTELRESKLIDAFSDLLASFTSLFKQSSPHSTFNT